MIKENDWTILDEENRQQKLDDELIEYITTKMGDAIDVELHFRGTKYNEYRIKRVLDQYVDKGYWVYIQGSPFDDIDEVIISKGPRRSGDGQKINYYAPDSDPKEDARTERCINIAIVAVLVVIPALVILLAILTN